MKNIDSAVLYVEYFTAQISILDRTLRRDKKTTRRCETITVSIKHCELTALTIYFQLKGRFFLVIFQSRRALTLAPHLHELVQDSPFGIKRNRNRFQIFDIH